MTAGGESHRWHGSSTLLGRNGPAKAWGLVGDASVATVTGPAGAAKNSGWVIRPQRLGQVGPIRQVGRSAHLEVAAGTCRTDDA
jgi:hypothetical protein